MTADAPRAQLIHIETDRRLGHEWDEWDGRPLPGNGDFSAPPGLFFRFAALTIGIGMAVGAGLIFLLGPRLGTLWSMLPRTLWVALGGAAAGTWVGVGTPRLSFYGGVLALPRGWARGGAPLPLVRRPRAVVAVACERDMMTGLRDVAGRLPVLGLTMRLPNGPCRDAMLDLDIMEEWVRGLVGA